jgi:Terminase RNaseH-like domain
LEWQRNGLGRAAGNVESPLSWLENLLADGEHSARLRNDLEYFAETALRLRPKSGPLEPFRFNAAQKKLHALIEEQKTRHGRVRVVILKARQLGISSYVAARLYHRTIGSSGVRTIILGHERRASSNLFQIVKRFHDNLSDELRPSVGTSNAEELIFDRLDSGYIVTVASGEGTGRSATAQHLHASEVAFWDDLPSQMAALMQTVPDLPGTEIILETTANGFNDFQALWRKAEAGESEFMPVFLPWSIDPGYRKIDAGFEMDSEERALADLHKLDAEQIAWRRAKISQLGSAERFPQEYPLVASEAFISSNFDSFISPDLVIKARREKVEPYGVLIIGVDPAGSGADRTSIAWRTGRCITKIESKRGLDTMEVAGWVKKIIREDKPTRVNIDVGGLGVGVYDRLIEQGQSRRVVQAVNFGGKAVEPPPVDEIGNPAGGPANRRAEMWSNLKKALEEGRVSLPDRDSLQADLVSCGYRYNSAGQLLIESKQDMRKRGVPSPDEADAVALCFADPIGGTNAPAGFNRDLREEYKKLGVYI